MHSHMFKTCQNSTPHLPLSFSLSFSVKPTLSNLLFFFQCDTDISLSLIDISFFTVVKVSLKKHYYAKLSICQHHSHKNQLLFHPTATQAFTAVVTSFFLLHSFLLYNKVHLLQLYTVISSLFFIFF